MCEGGREGGRKPRTAVLNSDSCSKAWQQKMLPFDRRSFTVCVLCADFMDDVLSEGTLPSSSYRLGVRSAPLHLLFPGGNRITTFMWLCHVSPACCYSAMDVPDHTLTHSSKIHSLGDLCNHSLCAVTLCCVFQSFVKRNIMVCHTARLSCLSNLIQLTFFWQAVFVCFQATLNK